jgi:hypothetical protein
MDSVSHLVYHVAPRDLRSMIKAQGLVPQEDGWVYLFWGDARGLAAAHIFARERWAGTADIYEAQVRLSVLESWGVYDAANEDFDDEYEDPDVVDTVAYRTAEPIEFDCLRRL